jgi:hypothetical protein
VAFSIRPRSQRNQAGCVMVSIRLYNSIVSVVKQSRSGYRSDFIAKSA